MSLYDGFMASFEKRGLHLMRQQLLDNVSGKVLEIGPGTGINLKYYDFDEIESLTYLDIDYTPGVIEKAENIYPDLKIYEGSVEKIPFADESFDHIIFTLVFCSVKNPIHGLKEIKRVLKKQGQIHYIEHVLPESQPYRKVFNGLTPLWKTISGGCHLNRETKTMIESVGFEVTPIPGNFKDVFIGGIGRKTKGSE